MPPSVLSHQKSDQLRLRSLSHIAESDILQTQMHSQTESSSEEDSSEEEDYRELKQVAAKLTPMSIGNEFIEFSRKSSIFLRTKV